jgi:multicomponent Na+:H+ antiporter subunit D
MMAGLNGVVLVKDIFSLYVYIEVVAASSFILIAFEKAPDALEAAFKYIILSTVATVLMLCSIGVLLMVSGGTEFSVIKQSLAVQAPHSFFILLAIAIFICGLFIKAGLMPFHGWLPDAYSAAPAGVSILLAGIATKTVGVYSLIRIVNSVFGFNSSINQILMLVGAASIVFGALVALTQSDFKRMLAYSSISQVGYIIIGLGCGTALGIAGAVFHLFNHAIFKSLLFVNSAAVERQAGTRDMNKLSGLSERMPVTGVTSAIGSLSAAGIPPLSGFWSKLMIVVALWISGNYFYSVVAIIAGVITLGYFLTMQRRVFFGKIKEEFKNLKEAPFALTLPAIILSVITIGVGLIFPFVYNIFLVPLRSVFGG